MNASFTSPSKPAKTPLSRLVASIMISTAFLVLCGACARPLGSERMAALGQTAEVRGWRVTVHSYFTLPADQWRQPADGHTFCAVELTLENSSGQIQYIMPEKQMLLFDRDGGVYAPDRDGAAVAARSLHWLVPEGEFAAGAQAHGAATYQVPIGSRGFRWVLRDSLFSWARTVSFMLGDVPQP